MGHIFSHGEVCGGCAVPRPRLASAKKGAQEKGARMRYCLFVAGLMLAAAPVHAEPRSAYVTMVLQAFAAKVECPGTDLVYQDLVQKAHFLHKPAATTEKVRKA